MEKNKNNLVIYQKYMELIEYTNNILRKYPKSETFALVKECKSTLHIMKVHIRLSYKYKYISMQNYQTWSNLITNICNMLGGWINSCQKR